MEHDPYEPVQEIILSVLRRRETARIVDLMHELGPRVMSVISREVSKMKEKGLVVYDSPLGPDSVIRLSSSQ